MPLAYVFCSYQAHAELGNRIFGFHASAGPPCLKETDETPPSHRIMNELTDVRVDERLIQVQISEG